MDVRFDKVKRRGHVTYWDVTIFDGSSVEAVGVARVQVSPDDAAHLSDWKIADAYVGSDAGRTLISAIRKRWPAVEATRPGARNDQDLLSELEIRCVKTHQSDTSPGLGIVSWLRNRYRCVFCRDELNRFTTADLPIGWLLIGCRAFRCPHCFAVYVRPRSPVRWMLKLVLLPFRERR